MSSPTSDSKPIISVIMCVYNGAEHLPAAIHSILTQTFTDFEFIIVDDGSTDETPQIIERYAARDSRIRVVRHANMGLTKSLNAGITLARGEFIARQDADDESYPARFQKQIDLLRARPEINLVGGCSDDLQANGGKTFWSFHDDADLARAVYYKTPFPHSTAIMRADVCWKLGCYDESYRTSQDMEFWMRFAETGKISMIKESVLLRRVGAGSISAKRRWRQFYDALRARLKHAPNGFLAVYHSLRSVIIALLPAPLIQKIKAGVR